MFTMIVKLASVKLLNKLLVLFLFAPFVCATDIQIRQLTSEQTDQGYIFRFVQDCKFHCWGMPQMLDQAFIPQTWTPVSQAAIDYRWPTMTGDAATACMSVPVPRTLGGPFITMDTGFNPKWSGGVPAGIVCGEAVGNGMYVVTRNGVTGLAECE